MAVAEFQVPDAIINNDPLSEEELEDGEIVEKEADMVRNLIQQKHREINRLKQVHFDKFGKMYNSLKRHEKLFNENLTSVKAINESTKQLQNTLDSKANKDDMKLIRELEDQRAKLGQAKRFTEREQGKVNSVAHYKEPNKHHNEELVKLNQILADKDVEVNELKLKVKALKSRKDSSADKPVQQQQGDGATEMKRPRLEN